MVKKVCAFITLAALLTCLFLSGCSAVENQIENYSDKVKCSLNSDIVTQFTYEDKSYTILENTVKKADLGGQVGYIRKLVVLSADGEILLQQDADKATLKTLADISDTQPNAAYMIQFLNVYACRDETNQDLIVDANGEYHRAILSDSVTGSDDVFDYSRQKSVADGDFSVNPQDCTQLIRADKIYQITDETVSDNQVGEYLDVIAESIVFDKDTKRKIPRKELSRIDWNGTGTQKRENWSYGEVHAIQNVDPSDSIAIEINSEYRIAACR